jgi:hypothetical protein
MSKLNEIGKGFKKLVLGENQNLAEERMKICNVCPKNSKNKSNNILPVDICMECGCVIRAKTRNEDSECPIGKW